jgi:hypothetical protein
MAPTTPIFSMCLFFVCRFPGDGFFSEDRDEERPDAFRRMDIADLRNVVFSYKLLGAGRVLHPCAARTRLFRLDNTHLKSSPPPPPSPPCPPAPDLCITASMWGIWYSYIHRKNLRKITVWGKIREPIKSDNQRQTERVDYTSLVLIFHSTEVQKTLKV